jgi:ABC-type amino acid transport substrate-binding protein
MSEERLSRRIRSADVDEAPDPAFVDRLYGQLATELGHTMARAAVDDSPVPPDDPLASHAGRQRWLLLAAALLLPLTLVTFVAGAALIRDAQQEEDRLAVLRSNGSIRIAVSRDHPQAMVAGSGLTGFDIDVARVIAERLGLAAELKPVAPGALAGLATTWDLALASGGPTGAPNAGLPVVEPIYYWPRVVLVRTDDPHATVADLIGLPVGAGPAAIDWAPAPPGAAIQAVASDEECLDLLDSGELEACLTSTFGPADLASRPRFRALVDGSSVDVRGMVLPESGPTSDRLVAEMSAVIDELRADGTFAELSLRRFGVDLTLPPE